MGMSGFSVPPLVTVGDSDGDGAPDTSMMESWGSLPGGPLGSVNVASTASDIRRPSKLATPRDSSEAFEAASGGSPSLSSSVSNADIESESRRLRERPTAKGRMAGRRASPAPPPPLEERRILLACGVSGEGAGLAVASPSSASGLATSPVWVSSDVVVIVDIESESPNERSEGLRGRVPVEDPSRDRGCDVEGLRSGPGSLVDGRRDTAGVDGPS